MDPYQYIVVCRGDTDRDGTPGAYELATRQVFDRKEAAEAWSRGIASGREAIVVEGRWHSMRFP